MKSLFKLVILLAASHFSNFSFAAVIHIHSSDSNYKGTMIELGGTHIGFIGDFIELSNGQHVLQIRSPYQHTLLLEVNVQGSNLRVIKKYARADNCVKQRRLTWAGITVSENKQYSNVVDLDFGNPVFGAPSDIVRCMQYMGLTCTPDKFVLSAVSSPKGAEIWIDQKKQAYKTDSKLSVPYCRGTSSLDVLVRLPGAINCSRTVSLQANANVSIDCSIEVPIPKVTGQVVDDSDVVSSTDRAWTCTRANVTRKISVERDVKDPVLACRVVYHSEEGVFYPWAKNDDRDYCGVRAREFSQKLVRRGWNCQIESQ